MVNHDLFLNKMEMAGIRGVALKWFRSFLTGRVQTVKIGNSVSSALPVRAGVPQGSVLATKSFTMFINDWLFQTFSGQVSAFAADLALLYYNFSSKVLLRNLNADLRILR